MATDNFDRADSATLGSNWTDLTSYPGMSILSNQAVATGAGYNFAYWNAVAFNADQYSQAIARNTTGSERGVIVRAVTADKCYFFDYSNNSGNAFLFLLNGGFTNLQSFGAVVNLDDVMKIEAIGTSIKCYVNGIQVGTTTTNAVLASGSPGVAGLGTGSGTVNDWQGGNTAAARKWFFGAI